MMHTNHKADLGLLGWRRTAFLLLVGALIAAAMLTGSSHAGTSLAEAKPVEPPSYIGCDEADIVHPFAAFDDDGKYVAITNGSFEDGMTGWTLRKGSATLVEGTNPNGSQGTALKLGKDSRLVSPPICFDESRPHARMFAKNENAKQRLEVEVTYARAPKGDLKHIDVGRIKDFPLSSDWAPTPEMATGIGSLRKKFVKPDAKGQRWFKFVFETKDKGSWTIDDLYVDPRARN